MTLPTVIKCLFSQRQDWSALLNGEDTIATSSDLPITNTPLQKNQNQSINMIVKKFGPMNTPLEEPIQVLNLFGGNVAWRSSLNLELSNLFRKMENMLENISNIRWKMNSKLLMEFANFQWALSGKWSQKNIWLFPSPIDHTQKLNGLKPYSFMKKTTNSSEKPSSNLKENTNSNMSTIIHSERLPWLEASILSKVNLNKHQFIILITKTSALQQDKPGSVPTRTNILYPGSIKTW